MDARMHCVEVNPVQEAVETNIPFFQTRAGVDASSREMHHLVGDEQRPSGRLRPQRKLHVHLAEEVKFDLHVLRERHRELLAHADFAFN